MKIPEHIANKIYNILVEIGASERMRNGFIYLFSHDNDIEEWRFQGKLGFGGKFWNEYSHINKSYNWRVSCYSEDETPEILQIINDTNTKLCELSEIEKLGRK